MKARRPSSRRQPKGAERFLEIIAAAGRLKTESRKGWVRKLGMRDPESVADHAYRTALMAMLYSDLRHLDTSRVVKMAILHDLPEAYVGDTIPGERTRRQKLELESAAMGEILKNLPPELGKEYLGIWKEYNLGRTDEARLVRQVDKLEMAVQAVEYRRAGTDEFLETAMEAITDKDLLDLLRLVSPRA